MVAHFGDRNRLASAVWARFVPELEEAAQRDLRLPFHTSVHASLDRVATIARRNRDLTAAFVGQVLCCAAERGAASPKDIADPRNIAPIHRLLEPAILQHRHQLRTGVVTSDADIADFATSLVQQTLSLALMQKGLSALEIADQVCTSTLAGMLKRRPGI
jgi:hypothetical protein